jgi:hypothetical protein
VLAARLVADVRGPPLAVLAALLTAAWSLVQRLNVPTHHAETPVTKYRQGLRMCELLPSSQGAVRNREPAPLHLPWSSCSTAGVAIQRCLRLPLAVLLRGCRHLKHCTLQCAVVLAPQSSAAQRHVAPLAALADGWAALHPCSPSPQFLL